MENGLQNAGEIGSQNAAKPSVIDRKALHGWVALGPEKKTPKLNSNRSQTPITGQLQPTYKAIYHVCQLGIEIFTVMQDLLPFLHWVSTQFCHSMGWKAV
jgi:hypothetical protein